MLAIWAAAAAFGGTLAAVDSEAEIERQLLAMERQAMDGWMKGDPDGDLAISDPSITYIHAAIDKRFDGLPAVREFFEKYRGTPLFDSYQITEPRIQVSGDTAILTFRFECHNAAGTHGYYSTQVFQRRKEGWRIIHAHWSKAGTQ